MMSIPFSPCVRPLRLYQPHNPTLEAIISVSSLLWGTQTDEKRGISQAKSSFPKMNQLNLCKSLANAANASASASQSQSCPRANATKNALRRRRAVAVTVAEPAGERAEGHRRTARVGRARARSRVHHVCSKSLFSNWPTQNTPVSFLRAAVFDSTSQFLALGNDKGTITLWELAFYRGPATDNQGE
jgi:hypothetical protein